MKEIGFVYVLTNPSMPGLVKIGRTGRLAEDRAKDLFATGVPEPFVVEYRALTSRPADVEACAHATLHQKRVNKRREFFSVSVDEAIEAVRLSAIEAAGINSWESNDPHNLREGDRLALNLESGQSFFHIFYKDMGSLIANEADVLDIYQAHSSGDLLEITATVSAGHAAGFADCDPGGSTDPVPYLDRERKAVNGMMNGRERLSPGERLVWLPAPEQAKFQAPVVFESETYCQLVSRTWSPKTSPEGFPLLLNIVTHDVMPPESVRAVRNALALPLPRSWAPRQDRDPDWVSVGTEPQPLEYWLPQLKIRPWNG